MDNYDEETSTYTLKIKSMSDEHEGTQKKTFTKWINSQLSKGDRKQLIDDLFTDLKDGTKLLDLLEVLCGKKIRREKGRMRVHQLNNVNSALRTLQQEKVKLVNISNEDIVNGNPKLTLGLIWNVIAHFQLHSAVKNLKGESARTGSMEESLLEWCKKITKGYKDVDIRNFTTSWRDGLAFNAIIHRFRPNMFDYDTLLRNTPSVNLEHAFKMAQSLGVDRLLDPEDVTQNRPDKKSIIMYVGSLAKYFANEVPSNVSPEVIVSTESVSENMQMPLAPTQNGQVVVKRTEKAFHRTEKTVKRTVTTSTSSQQTVKHFVTPNGNTNAYESFISSTTMSTSMRHPPTQHSSVTVVQQSIQEKQPVIERPLSFTERTLQERPLSFTEMTDSGSIRDSMGSFRDSERESMADREWEDYSANLGEVVRWLTKAEDTLKSQEKISGNVDVVKDQFHEHEDFMMDLTNHQANVGSVLEFGNQLISDGLVSEKEENEIRDQMMSLNDRWENLRISAMERQSKLHEQLMSLQQNQIDQLADWLTQAEKKIEKQDSIGSDLEAVKAQVDEHKVFQEKLEEQQQKVNSLTHMVVVVDENAGENATADLEEQLAVLGERWSSVCKWTEQRWIMLQDVLTNWQEYRDEERRLSEWLCEKERQVEEMKAIDLGDVEDVRTSLKQCIELEQEMEAQQATFSTFNEAAERVAENLDESSPGVEAIQDKMEEFNDNWNKITTHLADRLTLLKSLESKLQGFHVELDEKMQWVRDTETLLKSPNVTLKDETIPKEKLIQQSDLVESLDSAMKQMKPSVAAVQRKGEELIESCRAQGNVPVTLEQTFSSFNDRWENVGKLIAERQQHVLLLQQRRDVQELSSRLEAILVDAEKLIERFGDMPEIEYEINGQLEQCKHKHDSLVENDGNLSRLKDQAKSLNREDRLVPQIQSNVKKLDDRWTMAKAALEDRRRQLQSTLESGPPKQYLNTMDAVLLKIKNMETILGVEFAINETSVLEDQLQKYKELQEQITEQQKNMDYLNSTGEKFMRSLPRAKADQLRTKLMDLNHKWHEFNTILEKRITQVHKAVNQNRQYSEEMKSLINWMDECCDFVKNQAPAVGDPDTLEAQLDQSEALQRDISKLQRKLDSLNETGTYMVSHADQHYCTTLRGNLESVNMRWEELVRSASRQKDNLVAAMERYEKLSRDMKEMLHWIMQTERSIADDEKEFEKGELMKEKVEHYRDLQQEVSKRAPVVVRINTTCNQMIDHTKQGSTQALKDSLKRLNSDWARLKNKVAIRQHTLKQTMAELEQFNMALQRDQQLMMESDKFAEECYDYLDDSEDVLEQRLRNLNRHVAVIKVSGPGSVNEIANSLIARKLSVTVVRNQLSDHQSRLDSVRQRVDKTRQVLEGEILKRQQMKRDFDTIRTWIAKIDILINTRITRNEPADEKEIKTLEEEFSLNQALLESVEKALKELKGEENGPYSSFVLELNSLKDKWGTMKDTFVELKGQPTRKLETEFEAIQGEILANLDMIHRGVRRLKLESADVQDINLLLDQAKSYKDELASIAKDVEQVKKVGETLMVKRPEDSRAGIERRVDEVTHEHKELVNKVGKKHQQFLEAKQLAKRLEDDMSRLEAWLRRSKEEMKLREEQGFPNDVDAEIKWTKNLIQEVTGRMSEVQQLTLVGRELVDMSETGQLEALEDRLTAINNDWEELSSMAEQRLTVLPKYKQKVNDFEKAVDQMNCWLEEIERETSGMRVNDDQLEETEKKISKLNEHLKSHEPQMARIRRESGEFVNKGRMIMEPYKRLLNRRWDDLTAKINELERNLNTLKQQVKTEPRVETEVLISQRKVRSTPGMIEEWVRTEEQRDNESGVPFIEETITTRRTYCNSNKPTETTTTRIHTELAASSHTQDDFQARVDAILKEIKELEDILDDIDDPKKSEVEPVTSKLRTAEKHLDILQPRVELVLKESKLLAARDGARKDETRQALLDLSGRWLRACDQLEGKKKQVEIIPNWYQFKSNLKEVQKWIATIDTMVQAGREETILLNQEVNPDELEMEKEKYETVIKNLELLEGQGIGILPHNAYNLLKRRYKQINAQFHQYKRPDTTYRIAVITGDVKDADTRANAFIKLYGEKGTSEDLQLDKSETYNTKFCRDQLDIFIFDNRRQLGDLDKVRLWHDNTGRKPEWFVKAVYIQDKTKGKVYRFNVNAWIGHPEKDVFQYLLCSGFYIPKDDENIMTKYRLTRAQWEVPLVQTDKLGNPLSPGAGWELVSNIKQLSEELEEAENLLNSDELQGTDFENFSSQEDKLKQIGDKLEKLEPRASSALNKGGSLQSVCEEKEVDAVKRACSRFHLSWNTVNKNYKARLVRWEKSLSTWRQFHCDIRDLTSWLNQTEKALTESKTASGDLQLDKAKVIQKDLEDGIAKHQTTITSVNGTGEEIVKQSTQVEGDMLRDKMNTVNRRWQEVCTEVADRRDRFKEERMQTEEFMDESSDLLHWLDEVEAILRPKDPSPADEDGIELLLEKVTDLKKEKEAKEDTYSSVKRSGERLLNKSILSKPNNDAVRARLDLVNIRWERLCSEIPPRLRGLETKLQRVCQFLAELEELSLWAATTRELMETQVKSAEFSKGKNVEAIVEPKTVQDSLRSRQPARDIINDNMTSFRRDSKNDGSHVPKELEDKVKLLNEDWSKIASLAANLFAAKIRPRKEVGEEVLSEARQMTEESAVGVEWFADRSSPFPKFDKAVSELHEWLDTIEDMMKTEKIVLGDKEEMEGLAQKQKSVDEQLRSKQHLLDEIVAMGGALEDDAETREDRQLIETQVRKLRVHWEQVTEKSTMWKGQIDFLIEEWKRFVELRDELNQWLKKADSYFEREENVYGFTVSELEEQIEQHKEFEGEIGQWRGSISAVGQCGENLVQEFSQYEASELRNTVAELNDRWQNTVNRSDARRKHLKEAFDQMVRFHEDMINALTWLTSAESKVAELDSAVEITNTEERVDTDNLKTELNHLEEDINGHQEMFASLNENGHLIMEEMEQGEVLTAVQSKLDDMNDRWQSLNVRTLDIRDRLEESATEWRQLLTDLQETLEWITRADSDLNSQKPLGGDLETVQNQNEFHQGFKGRLNVRRLMVDKSLDQGKRCLEELTAGRSGESPSKQRVATSLQRQFDIVSDRWLNLCTKSEEWQKRLDEALRQLQVLQAQMDQIDQRLTEAEMIRNRWTPVQGVVIDAIHDQLEGMKAFQAKIAALQHMFENMGSAEAELHRKGVSLSTNLQNKIDQLYKRWKQLQNQMLSRQTVLQDACSDMDGTSLSGLAASVEPPWERAVALNKVPYYINHKTETTQWDHPRMTELYHQIAELNDIKYSAYRTAMKLRCIQKATCLDLVTLQACTKAFEQHNLQLTKNENYIGVHDMVAVLNTIYGSIDEYRDKMNIPFCVDLTLNWLLNVYDSGRVGKIRCLSFKIGVFTMSRAHLDEKYKFMFKLVADSNGLMDHKQFGLLLHDVVQVPRQLGEIAAFGGSNIEPSVRSCFEKNKAKTHVDCAQYLYWLSAEPQSIVWLPTLHRMAAAEAVKHKAKCNICKEYPIVGFRFRCLKCFNYDLCQSCFWSGRSSHNHRLTHPMHQYCLSTTSGEDAKDFLSMVRNKFKTRRYKNKPPRKLGYLPIQTVMEGGNLETPPMPSSQQAVNNEVHNRLGMYAHRLAEAEGNNNTKFPNRNMDDEHQLIAQYCQSLKNDSVDMPRSPSQIVMSLDAEEKDDLEVEISRLEDENRALQDEYERLKILREQESPSENESTTGQQNRDAELLAEAKLLRQHKGRLEARMQVLEDHNRQLEAQLQRLRQLLDQPGEHKGVPTRATPASSMSSLGDSPYNTLNRKKHNRADESNSDIQQNNVEMRNGLSDDPDLRDVMRQIDTSFPSASPSEFPTR